MYQVNSTRASYNNGFLQDDSRIITPETYAKDHGAVLSYSLTETHATFPIYANPQITHDNVELFIKFLKERNYTVNVDFTNVVSFAAPLVKKTN